MRTPFSSGTAARRPAPVGDAPVGIIGAGPGGLAAGAALKAKGIPFEIVDEGRRPGGIWDLGRTRTPMYETAHFISSRTLSAFPDLPMPEDYPDYPRHDQVLAYIESYAAHHGLEAHIAFGRTVVRATPADEGGGWIVELAGGETRRYSALIVATGLAWHPNLPEIPGEFSGEAFHSFDYRRPDQLAGRRVLVVGGGNSGCDIACDAARAADRAFLSLRRGYWFIPRYVLGKPADVFARQGPPLPAWLERRVFEVLVGKLLVGDLRKRGLPAPDHGILESHPIMNTEVLELVGHGALEVRGDLVETRGRTAVFADGRKEEVDVIVLATGYRRQFPFLEGDLTGGDGPLDLYLNVFHRSLDTLFFVGLFETDGGAYPLFHDQAHLIASFLADTRERPRAAERFSRRKATARPRLRARNYLPSQRHDYYVTRALYEKEVARARRAMGWGP